MLAPEETKIEIILVGRQQWNEFGTQASLHDKDACGDGLERLKKRSRMSKEVRAMLVADTDIRNSTGTIPARVST